MEAGRNLRPLVAGNWKMNGLRAQLAEALRVRDGLSAKTAADVMICPPATLLRPLAEAARGSKLLVGGPGLSSGGLRRLHRRHLGRDAQGCRAPLL